jgi:hypothetical protein
VPKESEHAEVEALAFGSIVGLAPLSASYLAQLAEVVFDISLVRASPAVTFYCVADAYERGIISAEQLSSKGWRSRLESLDFVWAVAEHARECAQELARLQEVSWRDGSGNHISAIGIDRSALEHFKAEWNESNSPLRMHKIRRPFRARRLDKQLVLDDGSTAIVDELADQLSREIGKPVTAHQALLCMLDVQMSGGDALVDGDGSNIVITDPLNPTSVSGYVSRMQTAWARYQGSSD